MSETISIIVPVYNVERYLKQCLDSIANQTYRDLKVILIDDGSTDSSGRICDDFCNSDSRFCVIHKENGGVSTARNTGLDAVTSKYIGFVDPDDWIDESMFEILYKDMTEYGVDMVMCSHYEVCDSEHILREVEREGIVSSDEALYYHLENLRAYLWCRLYRREVFEGKRFIEGRTFEDVSIMHHLIMSCNEIYFESRPLYYYRVNRLQSIVSTNTSENLKNYYAACIGLVKDIKKQKPEFVGRACRIAVIAYLSRCKKLTVNGKLTSQEKKELGAYKKVLLNELKGIHYQSNLLLKERVELYFVMVSPAFFNRLCRLYRKVIGRELG